MAVLSPDLIIPMTTPELPFDLCSQLLVPLASRRYILNRVRSTSFASIFPASNQHIHGAPLDRILFAILKRLSPSCLTQTDFGLSLSRSTACRTMRQTWKGNGMFAMSKRAAQVYRANRDSRHADEVCRVEDKSQWRLPIWRDGLELVANRKGTAVMAQSFNGRERRWRQR